MHCPLLRAEPVVEQYRNGFTGYDVHVYRADLIGDGRVLPSWGKLIGLDRFLATLDTSLTYYHLSVSPSYSGWALQVLAPYHGLQGKLRIVTTNSKTSVSLPTMLANTELDAPILLKPNMLGVQQAQVRVMAHNACAKLLPYGFWTPAYCSGIASTYAQVYDEVRPQRIVVAAGSGATLCAIAQEAQRVDADVDVVGVCCSSLSTVRTQVDRAKLAKSPRLVIAPAALEPPFASHVFWDQRAWRWLVESRDTEVRTLFWNLGA